MLRPSRSLQSIKCSLVEKSRWSRQTWYPYRCSSCANKHWLAVSTGPPLLCHVQYCQYCQYCQYNYHTVHGVMKIPLSDLIWKEISLLKNVLYQNGRRREAVSRRSAQSITIKTQSSVNRLAINYRCTNIQCYVWVLDVKWWNMTAAFIAVIWCCYCYRTIQRQSLSPSSFNWIAINLDDQDDTRLPTISTLHRPPHHTTTTTTTTSSNQIGMGQRR